MDVRWKGHATPEGTAIFSTGEVQGFTTAVGHFRDHPQPAGGSLTLSSIGVGTYLGSQDHDTDQAVENAIVRSISEGINVVDTAANYRGGRAEVSVGRALRALRLTGGAQRNHLFVSTKAGYAPSDDALHSMVSEGILTSEDVSGRACMHPAWLKASLERSLDALQLGTVDILYLHNVAESWISKIGRDEFMRRLEHAFEFCEEAKKAGSIQAYGLALWSCCRCDPLKNAGEYLALKDVVDLAVKVGGDMHGFRYIQLPINARMREAWEEPWQVVIQGEEERRVSLIDAAHEYGIGVFGSAALEESAAVYDGALGAQLEAAPELADVSGIGAKLLQIARSTPGIISSLVGHKRPVHVEENLAVNSIPPLDSVQFSHLMARVRP